MLPLIVTLLQLYPAYAGGDPLVGSKFFTRIPALNAMDSKVSSANLEYSPICFTPYLDVMYSHITLMYFRLIVVSLSVSDVTAGEPR